MHMRVRVYVVLVVLALRRSILKSRPCLCAVLCCSVQRLCIRIERLDQDQGVGFCLPALLFVLVQQRIVHFKHSA